MLRSAAVYLPSYLFPRVAAFFVILLGTRLLAPDEFGYFALVTIIGEFADAAMANWVRIAFSRFGAREGGVSYAFVKRMGGLAFICTLAALALSTGVANFLAPEKTAAVTLAVVAYILAAALVRFGVTLHQAMEHRKRASFLETARAVLAFLATVGAMATTGDFLVASLAASGINFVVGIAAVATGLKAADRALPNETPLKTILSFAAPLVILALLSQAITSLDKALLKAFHDAATLGFYAAAFAVGRVGFDVIAVAFNTGTFVRLSALFNEEKRDEAQKLLSHQIAYLLAIALPAAGFLIASRDMIARVLFPPAYFETFVTAIPLVALGAVALNLKNFVYDNIFHMHLRNLRQIPTLLVGAGVSAGLGFWLLPSSPVSGAAMMFAGGGVAALLMSVALTSSLMRVTIPWRVLFVATLLGLGAWSMAEGLKAALADAVPNTVLLVMLVGTGAVATGISLAWVWLQKQDDPSPIAVLHIISSLSMGGAEKMLCDILDVGSRNQNFHYHVLIINDVLDIHLLTRLQKGEVAVHLLRRPPGSRNFVYFLKFLSQLLTIRPRIVHCHTMHSLLWALCASCLLERTRFFWTVHDTLVIPNMNRLIHSIIRTRVDRIVAISQAVDEECRKSGLNNVHCIYNGIDLAMYRRKVQKNGKNVRSVITVGRLSTTEKGHDLLIEALAICRSRGFSVRAKFVGAESGYEPGVRQKLEALAREFSIAESVEFTGNRSDVPALLATADVFVFPSRYEGFGLVLVEAMAAGLPVIASDIEASREILRDGEYGLLFRSGDAESLSQALVRLYQDPDLRQRLVEKGQMRAQDFSIEKTVAGYEALYREFR